MQSRRAVWLLQHLLPKDLSSSVAYRLARSRRAWLKDPLIRAFANAYRVDMSEAQYPDLAHYATFNEFFTRSLRAGARPIAPGADVVVSPADGTLTEHGTIDGDRLMQAKGIAYSLEELLGESGREVEALRGGSYFTIYLAPHNYHRVHSPLDANLRRTRYLPGRRFSVSRATAASIEGIFCRNERAACWFDTDAGPLVVVLVGALNVSSISTFNLGEIPSGRPLQWAETTDRPVARGAEIGRFNMGSTVIVLLGARELRWDPRVANGAQVSMGTPIGKLSAGEPPSST
jgi:phosphatidylserine decarboxylase